MLYWKTRPLRERNPRVRLSTGRGGGLVCGGGNIDGKLYSALSPAPVGTGGQLFTERLQRGFSEN
ncbi:hypothetical protein HMPREF0239_02535 [Clostridium sp. ATCC BAA-442]|nr:hypothetical protein HMPREF0239_02535 [Clostridium sp. ATCC BAA-442]